ncbi:MAG: helix-turn-helix domain-containing protein [Parcubacteria group bacterium]|nr:helix-turn-helix domain-containing protein [Parcubacteria group bacterium]
MLTIDIIGYHRIYWQYIDKKLLSTTEAAKILGISRVAVFKKNRSGEIRARKVGRNFVIDERGLSDILRPSYKN